MTFGNRGRPLFLFLPGFGSFLGSAGIGIGGVLPIGTALVTEFAPRRIRARANITWGQTIRGMRGPAQLSDVVSHPRDGARGGADRAGLLSGDMKE
jgi:hypothetical protein